MRRLTDWMGRLREIGALRENGHFVTDTRRHASMYVDGRIISEHPDVLAQLVRGVWPRLQAETDAQGVIVVGPGAALTLKAIRDVDRSIPLGLTHAVTWDMSSQSFLDFPFEVGRLMRMKKIAVLATVITTAHPIVRFIFECRRLNISIVGVGTLVNASRANARDLDVSRFFSACEMPPGWYQPFSGECSLCVQGAPVDEDVGYCASQA